MRTADPPLPGGAIVLSRYSLPQVSQVMFVDSASRAFACVHYKEEADRWVTIRTSRRQDLSAVSRFRLLRESADAGKVHLQVASDASEYRTLLQEEPSELNAAIGPLQASLGWRFEGLALGYDAAAPHGRCVHCDTALGPRDGRTLCAACQKIHQQQEAAWCAQFRCQFCRRPLTQRSEVEGGVCETCDYKEERAAMRRLGAVPD